MSDPVVAAIAQEAKKSPAQVLLRWAVQQGVGKTCLSKYVQGSSSVSYVYLSMSRVSGFGDIAP